MWALPAQAGQDIFPEGPAKPIVVKQCTMCHTAERIVETFRSKEEWGEVLTRMTDFGAELTEAERTAVHEYLAEHFAPPSAVTAAPAAAPTPAAPVAPAPQQPSREFIQAYIEKMGAEPLVVHKLPKDVYWVQGAGGNSGVVVGPSGVVVVDAKTTAGAGKRLLEEAARITPKPVTHVILTHSDGDHLAGLASFPSSVSIIAHETSRKDMEAANAAAGMGSPMAVRLPDHTFTTKESLTLSGVRVELLHYGPSHTSGDTVIYLPEQKVVFTGDILAWSSSPSPIIHEQKGGSAAGWLSTVKKMLDLEADTYVTGHGTPQTKAELKQKLAQFEEQYEQIKAMVAQGRSLEEVEKATSASLPPPAPDRIRFPSFATAAYHQLTKK